MMWGDNSGWGMWLGMGISTLILVVLTFLSVPAWSKIKMSQPPSDLVIHVNAKQFNWQVSYPGPDGKFGTEDDKQFLDEMHVPVNKPVAIVTFQRGGPVPKATIVCGAKSESPSWCPVD